MKFKNKLLIIHILFIFILNISITSLATTLENNVQSTPNSTEQISKENENLELNLFGSFHYNILNSKIQYYFTKFSQKSYDIIRQI